jgi:hypothetical protein
MPTHPVILGLDPRTHAGAGIKHRRELVMPVPWVLGSSPRMTS